LRWILIGSLLAKLDERYLVTVFSTDRIFRISGSIGPQRRKRCATTQRKSCNTNGTGQQAKSHENGFNILHAARKQGSEHSRQIIVLFFSIYRRQTRSRP